MKRILLYVLLFASVLSAYAVDPLGSRVDFGDNTSSSGDMDLIYLVIILIGVIDFYLRFY